MFSNATRLIVVGASAGGVEALKAFFHAVTVNSGCSFFIIQHLPSYKESTLVDIIASFCALPVAEGSEGDRFLPNLVTLCPPGYFPSLLEGCLHLEPRSSKDALFLPINVFLKSLPDACGAYARAVILSGAGSDGAEGAQYVSAAGGAVFAQTPEDAEFASMPQSVLNSNAVVKSAPAGKIWALIEAYESDLTSKQALTTKTSAAPNALLSDRDYSSLFGSLQSLFDFNLSEYRIESVERRVNQRMQLLKMPTMAEYSDYIRINRDEAEALYEDLLIRVTCFFRDEPAFEALGEALREKFEELSKEGKTELRLWVSACATGEEAYSTLMLADEVAQAVCFTGSLSLFATDIFKPAIKIASRGIYTAACMEGLSEKRRAAYFDECSKGTFRIKSDIRSKIVFAKHNLLKDTPFANMDVVSCRNLLIYLKPDVQRTALQSLSFALKDRGILFLGGSESLGDLASDYIGTSTKNRVFTKKSENRQKVSNVQRSYGNTNLQKFARSAYHETVTIKRELLAAYDSMLDRYAPCGFLISEAQEILHYFGDSANYCVNMSGRVSNRVSEQLDGPLKTVLGTLLFQASHQGSAVTSRGIQCRSKQGEVLVDLSVNPLDKSYGGSQLYVVEIKRLNQSAVSDNDEEILALGSEQAVIEVPVEKLKVLEEELQYTRESLQAANEELHVSNEELQSLNEELQVSNEELQATNDQVNSMNEELQVLNSELTHKNEAMDTLNVSHENLLKSTVDGVLYVDRECRIMRFNKAIQSAFNLLDTDLGRPLADIVYKLDAPTVMLSDVSEVLQTGKQLVRESELSNERTYLKRIHPFLGSDEGIIGAILTFTDVTKMVALRRRFQFAMETAAISWWDWDLETGQLDAYSEGPCAFGDRYDCEVRSQSEWLQEVHPDDLERVEQSLKVLLSGESEEWQCEHRFRVGKDEWLWVKNSGWVTRRNRDGKALMAMGTTQNVDTAKQTLVEALSKNDLLNTVGEIVKMGTWEYTVGTDHLHWSKQTREILGVDSDYNPTVENGFPFFSNADSELLKSAFEKVLAEGVGYNLRLHVTNKRGEHLIVRSACRARFDEGGKVQSVSGIFQDITKESAAEHEIHAFFDLSPDMHSVIDVEGSFLRFNQHWMLSLGYNSQELLSKDIFSLIPEPYRDSFADAIESVIKGAVLMDVETPLLIKGEVYSYASPYPLWVSWTLSYEEEFKRVFLTARDITRRRLGAQELEAALVTAEAANRAKSDFLAVMSHELRTPLNPVMGFAEILIEEIENPEHLDLLTMIKESGSHLISIIDEILVYSKGEAGKLKSEPYEFSLEKILKQIMRTSTGLITRTEVSFEYKIDKGVFKESGLPIFIGDVVKLERVLRNLVSNAIKFTDRGSVILNVAIQSLEEDAISVYFEIKDTGIGIDASKFDLLFKPFVQVHMGSTRAYGGTGLGLSICEQLVELMGGEIKVSSKLGEGSCFSFTLPFKVVDAPIVPEVADTLAEGAGTTSVQVSSSAEEILIIEDNESNVFFLRQVLNRIGYKVIVASDGERALKLLDAHTYEFIFLDLHLPGINGFDILNSIRQQRASNTGKQSVVFVLTADVSEETRQRCLENGADEFLAKPLSPQKIREVLASYQNRASV